MHVLYIRANYIIKVNILYVYQIPIKQPLDQTVSAAVAARLPFINIMHLNLQTKKIRLFHGQNKYGVPNNVMSILNPIKYIYMKV
jgi:hypothetical protein